MTNEPIYLIGGPVNPGKAVATPQKAAPSENRVAEVVKVITAGRQAENASVSTSVNPVETQGESGRYLGKTQAQWLEKAKQSREFKTAAGRSDARRFELCAELAATNGIREFPALFTLTGALVAEAVWVKRRGSTKWVWRIDTNPVAWFDPSRALSGATRRRNDAAKGFQVGVVRTRAFVGSIVNPGSVGYFIGRDHKAPVEIVDNGAADGLNGREYVDRYTR